jgi:hypothetical protein
MVWKSVSVVDNEHMNVPHVLQQRYIYEQNASKDPSERELVPADEHRLVSVTELDGVEDR